MKNRNKRFTSVVAASMALAAIAPVAPVFAAQYSSEAIKAPTSSVQTSTDATATNLVFSEPEYDAYSQTYTTTLMGYTEGLTGDVVIPSYVTLMVDGKKEAQSVKVVAIADDAFQTAATSTLPNSYSPWNLQQGFDGIVSVTIPSTIESIGKYAFAGCEKLTKVVINGSGTTIDKYAFANNDKLSTVVLNGVTSIGWGAFARDYSLTTVALPSSLGTIDSNAFLDCTNLKEIGTLPDGLTTIGASAFAGTQISGEIAIPSSVTTIGNAAFQTKASSLILMLPATPKLGASDSAWFGTDSNVNSYTIYGYQTAEEIKNNYSPAFGERSQNLSQYKQRPVLTATRLGANDLPVEDQHKNNIVIGGDTTRTAMTINLGDSVKIENTNKIENGTLVIDGKDYTLNASNSWIYTFNTPTLGTHTIYMVNEAGIKSAELTVTVVSDKANQWTKYVTDPITVEYGSVADIDFAAAEKGTVVYLFSDALNGKYTTTEPTEVGDYFVKAIVNPGTDYVGLDAKAVVSLTIVQATNEWTEDLTVTDGVASAAAKFGTVVYTYYDAEGNKLDAAPTEAGTYSVVASVAETDNYTGLTSDAVEYTIEETNQGWVKNEDGTWSYQDGSEWLMNGKYDLPVENGSDEVETFWFVDGVMQKGWYESNSDKQNYFSTVSGAMLKNRWVSVDAEGNYVDWRTDRDAVAAYYYVDADGNVVKDVFKYDEACTYGGEADGHYYAFAKDGAMLTGFVPHNGKEYYFSPATGIMKTGWAKIDGKWYYFAEDGAMAKDETIDGWYVNADGVWEE